MQLNEQDLEDLRKVFFWAASGEEYLRSLVALGSDTEYGKNMADHALGCFEEIDACVSRVLQGKNRGKVKK